MRLSSSLNPKSPEFHKNREFMLSRIALLEEHLEKARNGDPRGAERMRKQGKMLPQERLKALLDPGSPFIEICPLAALGFYDNEAVGASQLTGIGKVSGRWVMLLINDATVKGGAAYPMTLQKILRVQQIARENKLPLILGLENAGAHLEYQSEMFTAGGRSFANQARMPAPQIALVFGSCTAGGAYNVGLADYVVMVRGQAQVFLGGPPLVKMATGEIVDEESLGGAALHAGTSGLADFVAEDDAHAIEIGRDLVAQLPYPEAGPLDGPAPAYDPEELLGIVPQDGKVPFDIQEVIARLVDESEFDPFKARYGTTLVAGWARIAGRPVGIVANNGVLFSESALKATHFIQLCNRSDTPILYLHNITGFMVGSGYEKGGIIKHGSSMIRAVANSRVPQFSVIVGGSYGAGHYAMCGRGFDPRFLFTWPNSRVAVMGGAQAAGVLTEIRRSAAQRRGQEVDEARLAASHQKIEAGFEAQSDAFFGSARLWDDGIIDPRQTRTHLSVCMQVADQEGACRAADLGALRF